MRNITINVSTNRVTYTFSSPDNFSILDIIKDGDYRRVIVNGKLSDFDREVCEDFAYQMIDNHLIFTASDIQRLSGNNYSDDSIIVIDNLDTFDPSIDQNKMKFYLKESL